jgi:PAS domain S-box-containing protein
MRAQVMLTNIAHKLFKLHFGYLLLITVVTSEFFTSFMSVLLRGRITLDYLITGGVVSLLVASLLLYFIKYNSELTEMNKNLQNEITHRKKIEMTLTKASRDWKSTFDATKDMIFMLNEQFNIIKINMAAAHFLNKTVLEILWKNFFELFDNLVVSRDIWPVQHIKDSKKHEEAEVFIASRDIWLFVSADPVFNEAGEVSGTVLFLTDITEVKKMQDSTMKAKNDWEDSFNTINDAITIHDKDFNIIRANRAAEDLLKLPYSVINSQKCFASYHGTDQPPEGCPSCDTLKTGLPCSMRLFEPHIDRHIEIKALARYDKNNNIIGLIHIVRDITALKKAEKEQEDLQAQFLQIQKMESVGRLAGGIAHDFNNLLTTIIGYSDLSLMKLPNDNPIAENLSLIRDAGEKAAKLTKQLLAFSRKQILNMQNVNVESTVTNMAKILSRMIGEDIEIEIKAHGKNRLIKADPIQIEQVIMNLVVNARDAMPAGGKLIIDTSEKTIDEEFARMASGLKLGSYLMLSFTDNGAGISEETREKIFEPFFTTKEVGKGTGLGLATVFGIVKQHKGHITVDSAPGEGTTFRIYFPLIEEQDIADKDSDKDNVLLSGTETVLVIDDEPTVRKLIVDTLEPLGYKLFEAQSGHAAVEKMKLNGGTVDLLITDVIMPGMNGKAAIERIKSRIPKVKVLYMSGYADERIQQYGIQQSGESFMHKPVTPNVIAQKVRSVLDT